MKERTPLQLTPRTTTSGTTRSRSTQNNDLYGGALPREDVLAARITARRDPRSFSRYPSTAHCPECPLYSNPNNCHYCDTNGHTAGVHCPVIHLLCPQEFPHLQNQSPESDSDTNTVGLWTARLVGNIIGVIIILSLAFLLCFSTALLGLFLGGAIKGARHGFDSESQTVTDFDFSVTKFDFPVIDKFDFQVFFEFESITKVDSPFIAIELDSPTVVDVAPPIVDNLARFDSPVAVKLPISKFDSSISKFNSSISNFDGNTTSPTPALSESPSHFRNYEQSQNNSTASAPLDNFQHILNFRVPHQSQSLPTVSESSKNFQQQKTHAPNAIDFFNLSFGISQASPTQRQLAKGNSTMTTTTAPLTPTTLHARHSTFRVRRFRTSERNSTLLLRSSSSYTRAPPFVLLPHVRFPSARVFSLLARLLRSSSLSSQTTLGQWARQNSDHKRIVRQTPTSVTQISVHRARGAAYATPTRGHHQRHLGSARRQGRMCHLSSTAITTPPMQPRPAPRHLRHCTAPTHRLLTPVQHQRPQQQRFYGCCGRGKQQRCSITGVPVPLKVVTNTSRQPGLQRLVPSETWPSEVLPNQPRPNCPYQLSTSFPVTLNCRLARFTTSSTASQKFDSVPEPASDPGPRRSTRTRVAVDHDPVISHFAEFVELILAQRSATTAHREKCSAEVQCPSREQPSRSALSFPLSLCLPLAPPLHRSHTMHARAELLLRTEATNSSELNCLGAAAAVTGANAAAVVRAAAATAGAASISIMPACTTSACTAMCVIPTGAFIDTTTTATGSSALPQNATQLSITERDRTRSHISASSCSVSANFETCLSPAYAPLVQYQAQLPPSLACCSRYGG